MREKIFQTQISYQYRCRECGARSDHWTSGCPACTAFGAMVVADGMEAIPQEKKRKTLADAPALTGLRISTGIDGLDRVLGADWRTGKRGVHVPSTVLFAGAAGCGKSTLLLQMAARINTRRFLYLSSEQILAEIKENAERIGLSEEEIGCIEADRVVELSQAIQRMHDSNPQVVVVDSLNELLDSPNDRGDVQANMIRITTALKEEAERHNRAIFLITHMNKKEEISGVQRIQHIVSAVMKIERDATRGKMARSLGCPDKNRFGSTDMIARFVMTKGGLEDVVDAPEEELVVKQKEEDV